MRISTTPECAVRANGWIVEQFQVADLVVDHPFPKAADMQCADIEHRVQVEVCLKEGNDCVDHQGFHLTRYPRQANDNFIPSTVADSLDIASGGREEDVRTFTMNAGAVPTGFSMTMAFLGIKAWRFWFSVGVRP